MGGIHRHVRKERRGGMDGLRGSGGNRRSERLGSMGKGNAHEMKDAGIQQNLACGEPLSRRGCWVASHWGQLRCACLANS